MLPDQYIHMYLYVESYRNLPMRPLGSVAMIVRTFSQKKQSIQAVTYNSGVEGRKGVFTKQIYV